MQRSIDVATESVTKRPVSFLAVALVIYCAVWLPFLAQSPELKLETKFEAYLSSEEPAFLEYQQVQQLFKTGDEVVKRQLQQGNKKQLQTVEVLYECVSENCATIFTVENLERIKTFEREFEKQVYKSPECEQENKKCIEANSILNFFYPTRIDQSSIRLDGNGDELMDIQMTLKAIKKAGETWFFSSSFLLDGDRSLVARSSFSFDLGSEEAFTEFSREVMLPFLQDNQDLSSIRVLWVNRLLNEEEVRVTVYRDLYLAAGSFCVVSLILWARSRSFFLTVVAVLCVALCYPAAYVVYRWFLGNEIMMVFNFTSVFVLIGLGADDFFIFYDLWVQSCQVEACKTIQQRFAWMFRRAAGATLVTSVTTAASFMSNLASSIESIRAFGSFMGIIVILLYLHIVLALPPALVVYDRYFKNLSISALFSRSRTSKKDSPTVEAEIANPTRRNETRTSVANAEEENNNSIVEVSSVAIDSVRNERSGSSVWCDSFLLETNREPIVEPEQAVSNNKDTQKDSSDYKARCPSISHSFENKIGPFVYRFRFPLCAFFLALSIGLAVPLANSAEISDDLPQVFSPDSNLGRMFKVVREYFPEDVPAPIDLPQITLPVCPSQDGCDTPSPEKQPTASPTRAPTTSAPTIFSTLTPTTVPQPSPPPVPGVTRVPTSSPTASWISPILGSVKVLNRQNSATVALAPSFSSDIMTYRVFPGPFGLEDLLFLARPSSPKGIAKVEILSPTFVQVYVENAWTEMRYNFSIVSEAPCEACNQNGICIYPSADSSPQCRCFQGYSWESNCTELDASVSKLNDKDVVSVRVSWLRQNGFESFVDLQESIVEFCNLLDNVTTTSQEKGQFKSLAIRKVSRCVLRDLRDSAQGEIIGGKIVRFPMTLTESDFSQFLQSYMYEYDSSIGDSVVFDPSGERIMGMSIQVLTEIDSLLGANAIDPYYHAWDAFVKSRDSRLLQTSFVWARSQTELAIVRGTFRSAVISVSAAFGAVLLFTKFNVLVTIATTLSIACVTVLLLSTIVLGMDRRIGAVESLSCIVLIGMAVDYSVHLAHTFDHLANLQNVEDRTKRTLGQTGVSIFFGALTTFAAALLLLFSDLVLFRDFGSFVLLNTLYSFILATFFLMSLFAILFSLYQPKLKGKN